MRRTAALLFVALALGAATAPTGDVRAAPRGVAKHEAPIPKATLALMRARKTTPNAPILIRIYKKEAELEVWKMAASGRYILLKIFPICRWSGQLGPKMREGDRQAPEGFYMISPKQMNPNSSYHLSFDIGFPNAYDRAQGASGAFLMVHGSCSSRGCYAMTDEAIEEIYALAREAFRGGQKAFQFQAYPFRMTAKNMARYRSDRHIAFWRQLKAGSDRFEATGEEVPVSVSGRRYAFGPFEDPQREALAQARLAEEDARIAALVGDGAPAVRTTYQDGGQHPSFAALFRKGVSLGVVSRPEALAFAGLDVVVTPERARPRRKDCDPADGCGPRIAALPEPRRAQEPEGGVSSFAKTSRTASVQVAPPSDEVLPLEPDAPLYAAVRLGYAPSHELPSQPLMPGSTGIPPAIFVADVRFVVAARAIP